MELEHENASAKKAELAALASGDVSAPADELEIAARTPLPVNGKWFNPNADLPYGLTVKQVRLAMAEFLGFLSLINQQLGTRQIARLETILMQANFSSMVGEFVGAGIAKHCPGLVKNGYHNGHPDLIPAGLFPEDAVQHADQGIEIKGSRYKKAWQGHNPEDTWLMVFVFECNRPADDRRRLAPMPFRFTQVLGARLLAKDDWKFSGRREGSRRTITASVTPSGYEKMAANWIYRVPEPPRIARTPKKRQAAGPAPLE